MRRSTDSALARYIDGLERELRGLRPQQAMNPWHMLLGAVTLAGAAAIACTRPMIQGALLWPVVALAGIAGAAAFGFVGRVQWNSLLAGPLLRLVVLVRNNLHECELLLLCMQDDLPARYEKLRYVAQSYGKTRAANWNELRKGSMVDRVKWLVENYRAICGALGLPATDRELRRRQIITLWVCLGPMFLMLLGIVVVAYGASQGPAGPAADFLLWSVALMILGAGAGSGLAMQQQKIERGALTSVLVAELDLTDPQPSALAAPEQDAVVGQEILAPAAELSGDPRPVVREEPLP